MNAGDDEDDDTYDFFVVREREEGEIWSADESMEEVQVPEEQVGQADEEEVGEIAVSSLTSSIVHFSKTILHWLFLTYKDFNKKISSRVGLY